MVSIESAVTFHHLSARESNFFGNFEVNIHAAVLEYDSTKFSTHVSTAVVREIGGSAYMYSRNDDNGQR